MMFNPILLGDGLDDELPPALEKIRAQLREAGPLEEDDPIHALSERAMLGKAAAPGSEVGEQVRRRMMLEKFCGEEAEADSVPSEPVGELLARASSSPLLAKSMNPTLRKGAGDPTWNALLGAGGSTDARLAGPQRHDDVFRKPQVAEGEPLAHEDGAVTRTWPEGSTTVIWKDGKIIASRTQYQSADGTEVEFYDGTGDEISEGEYARRTRLVAA